MQYSNAGAALDSVRFPSIADVGFHPFADTRHSGPLRSVVDMRRANLNSGTYVHSGRRGSFVFATESKFFDGQSSARPLALLRDSSAGPDGRYLLPFAGTS